MAQRREEEGSPKIEIERTVDPRIDEIEDRIADLVAEALYNHILRKGLLKKNKLSAEPRGDGCSRGSCAKLVSENKQAGKGVETMPVALEEEYQVFSQRRAELLTKGEHKFVLIKGHEIVDVFVSYEDALKEGLKRFGNVPFLIKEIQREEEVNFFYTHPLR